MIIPLYIQETRIRNQTTVQVRPLFSELPMRGADLLSRAMARFSHDFRKYVDQMVKQDRHDELVRFTFSPDTESHQFDELLSLRRQTLRCRFLLVTFEALGRRIGFSPSVPDVWFDIAKGQTPKSRAIEAYTDHFRDVEREREEGTISPPGADYVHGWIRTTDFDVSLYKSVEKSNPQKFMALFEPTKMDGREELEKVGRRLESLYPDDLDRAVLRENEVEDLNRRLRSTERRPVLLMGPRQVGKTALVHEVVFRKLQNDPRQFRHREDVWLVSPQRLISGMMYAGQWESRLLAILKWAKERDHVLYFDDLPGLLLAGVSANSDLNVAQVLRPYIERRDVRVLGEITPEGFSALEQLDRGLAELFEIVRISEPGEENARRILIAVVRNLEAQHECMFDLDVLPTLMDLQRRYARDQALPGKVAGLLRRLAAKFAKEGITRENLLEEYHQRSGISMGILDQRQKLERRTVVEALAANVSGQSEAVEAMADAVSIAKAQLNDPDRPLATFLFLGPTGVGKTQSAKALAAYLFGNADRLLRLDMNEYVDPQSASRLVGTWREPEGVLTSAIRRQPYAVVLLDEIEKAHGDVHDLLLQMLGEGRLTDSLGRTADFTNAVVVMTSNLGVRDAEAAFGFGAARGKSTMQANAFRLASERFFRPEFFNRIDRIIPFARLSREDTRRIARRLLDEVFARDGLRQRRAILCVEDAAFEYLVDQGYQPRFGARALKRAVEEELTRPIAAKLAAIEPGAPTLVNVFRTETGIGVELRALRYAMQRIMPQFGDASSVLDAVDEAMDRLDAAIARLQPKGRIALDAVETNAARYFAMRELQGKVDRMLERLGKAESDGEIRPVRTRLGVGVRGGNKRSVLAASPRRGFGDVFAADDIRQYLASVSTDAKTYGSTGDHQVRELVAELSLLEAMAGGSPTRVVLAIREIVPGGTAAAKLASFYSSGLGGTPLPRAKNKDLQSSWRFLLLSGGEAAALATAEVGVHLFVGQNLALYPVQVAVIPLVVDEDAPSVALAFTRNFEMQRAAVSRNGQYTVTDSSLYVLRVYDECTLDLRTGLVMGATPSPADIRAVLIAALPPSPEIEQLAADREAEGGNGR